MGIHSKVGLAALAVVLSCAPIFSQGGVQGGFQDGAQGGPPQGPPPGLQGPPGGDGFRQRWPMWRRWGQGNRMGMRGQDGIGRRMGVGPGWFLNDPAVRARLGITADQDAKMRQQESDFRKAEIRDRADLQIKRIDLNDLLAADNPNRAAIDAKLQEVGAAQVALERSAIDFRLNMRDALTPAQRERLRQMMATPTQQNGNVRAGGPQGGGRGGQRGARGGGTGPGVGNGAESAPPNPQGQAPPPNR